MISTENSYFLDITNEFVGHFFEIISTDKSNLSKMLTETCVLFDDGNKVEGRDNVAKKILELAPTKISSDKFCGQPYGQQNGIIINTAAKINSHAVSITFILDEVDNFAHRFGISFLQIFHP